MNSALRTGARAVPKADASSAKTSDRASSELASACLRVVQWQLRLHGVQVRDAPTVVRRYQPQLRKRQCHDGQIERRARARHQPAASVHEPGLRPGRNLHPQPRDGPEGGGQPAPAHFGQKHAGQRDQAQDERVVAPAALRSWLQLRQHCECGGDVDGVESVRVRGHKLSDGLGRRGSRQKRVEARRGKGSTRGAVEARGSCEGGRLAT